MAEGSEGKKRSGWWKTLLLGLGAAVAAAIAWGAMAPEPEEELEAEETEVGPALVAVPVPVDRQPPEWVKPTILWTVGVVVGVIVLFVVLGVLQQVVLWLLLALFFSFALEPAANRLVRRGWRRGSATGLLLAVTFVAIVGIGLVFVVAIVRGAAEIAQRIPEWSQQASEWASDTFGVTVGTEGVSEGATSTASALNASAAEPVKLLLGFTSSLIGGIFAMFTVGMFIFYMVAEGPKFKRAVLSFFPRQRQEELVSIWEAAIDKTGSYFYSKLLLAVINGGLFFIVLLAVGMPFSFALALSTFQGVVAEFIPIVGTYIAAIVPLVAVLFTLGNPETLIVLIYVLIYQQVENYLLAPRLQSRTMQLHPAVAFGAALAGGAIGGLLWAFLAIPFAATVQASASLYLEHHEVLEVELTAETVPAAEPKERRSMGHRVGGFLRKSRGWIRRGARDAAEVLEQPDEPEEALAAETASAAQPPEGSTGA